MNESPYTYRHTGKSDGPHIVILGGVHGNEHAGIQLIEKLHLLLKKEEIHGTVTLMLGNPKAYEQNVRFLEKDLNRLFSIEEQTRIEQLSEKQRCYEEQRSLELASVLSSANYLLDIHSTVRTSLPFVYCKGTKSHHAIGRLFDAQYIVSPEAFVSTETTQSCTDTFVDRHDGIGVTFETGWLQDDVDLPWLLTNVQRFLQYLCVAFQDAEIPTSTLQSKSLTVFDQVIAKTSTFSFVNEVDNFDPLKKGDLLAYDDEEIYVPEDCYAVFPKAEFMPGKVACYFANQNNVVPVRGTEISVPSSGPD